MSYSAEACVSVRLGLKELSHLLHEINRIFLKSNEMVTNAILEFIIVM